MSNAVLSWDNPAYNNVPSNQSLAAKGSVIQNTQLEVIFWIWAFGVTLTLQTAKKPCNDSTVQKVLSGQTFSDILKFCCDLDLEHSNQLKKKNPQDSLAYDKIP